MDKKIRGGGKSKSSSERQSAQSLSGHLKARNNPSKFDDRSIELMAYQLHHEKGGSALDNWLEAEQNLKSSFAFSKS